MLTSEILHENNPTERWLLIIDDKPGAYYDSEQEAKKIKAAITRKHGLKYKIEIKRVARDKYKINDVKESLISSNRDTSGSWVSRWVLYIRDATGWKPIAHFRTEDAARTEGRAYAEEFGSTYKVELKDVPKTQYSEDMNVSK